MLTKSPRKLRTKVGMQVTVGRALGGRHIDANRRPCRTPRPHHVTQPCERTKYNKKLISYKTYK